MMGAGKSMLARILAQRLDWIWIDSDACVERNSCMPLTELFALFGEEEFRRRERECIQQTVKFRNIVVACGGGAPCYFHAMDFMLSNGIVVYLSARIDTLINRLQMEENTRPLLSIPDISLEERLRIVLAERESVYQLAPYTIETDGLSEEEVVDMVFGLTSQNVK